MSPFQYDNPFDIPDLPPLPITHPPPPPPDPPARRPSTTLHRQVLLGQASRVQFDAGVAESKANWESQSTKSQSKPSDSAAIPITDILTSASLHPSEPSASPTYSTPIGSELVAAASSVSSQPASTDDSTTLADSRICPSGYATEIDASTAPSTITEAEGNAAEATASSQLASAEPFDLVAELINSPPSNAREMGAVLGLPSTFISGDNPTSTAPSTPSKNIRDSLYQLIADMGALLPSASIGMGTDDVETDEPTPQVDEPTLSDVTTPSRPLSPISADLYLLRLSLPHHDYLSFYIADYRLLWATWALERTHSPRLHETGGNSKSETLRPLAGRSALLARQYREADIKSAIEVLQDARLIPLKFFKGADGYVGDDDVRALRGCNLEMRSRMLEDCGDWIARPRGQRGEESAGVMSWVLGGHGMEGEREAWRAVLEGHLGRGMEEMARETADRERVKEGELRMRWAAEARAKREGLVSGEAARGEDDLASEMLRLELAGDDASISDAWESV